MVLSGVLVSLVACFNSVIPATTFIPLFILIYLIPPTVSSCK